MGKHVAARCHLCDYATVVVVGGTRMDYRENDPFPIYCFPCGDISSCNDALSEKYCRHCGSTDIAKYGDDTRSVETTQKWQTWDEGDHFCPKCKRYGLRFELPLMFSD